MKETSRLKMTWPKVPPLPISGCVVLILTRFPAQKILRELKSKISSQSKKNFVLEKDVRYLDSRIALLIQNRMALEEVRAVEHHTLCLVTDNLQQNEVASHLEDATDVQEGAFPNDDKTQKYGNLLFLLQSEPRHIAHLCRLVSMAEIDSLLQTVMFTIYGNQYESREEHLLLTMFQVGHHPAPPPEDPLPPANIALVRPHLPVRQYPRIFFSPPREHPRIENDDDLHPTWPRSEFPQDGAG